MAIADLTKAIELDPYSAAAYYGRGLVYKDRRKNDLAITDFRKVVLLTKDPELAKTVMQEIQNLSGYGSKGIPFRSGANAVYSENKWTLSSAT